MRKNTKQGLLDLIKTMYDAHNEIKRYIKNTEIENAGNLLADCQDAVISIGEKIQSSEGEDFVTIGIIEKYCHDLFDVYNSLNEDVDFDSVYKLLNRDLTDIKKSIEKDIIGKSEVVFLPYKASMWDSLESVWKAADEDPECDVYVVPIPYYDRNPDHSFGEFHYEGGEYPDYVPVTHYNNYDISKRRPDVIYIHNPYDDCNYVTSVDPRFYSRELKKYTDKLVYIPYFVVDDSRDIDKIEHYALAPAVINADLVIVQSEKVRQKYIDVLLPHYGNSDSARKWLNDKILGMGSPKFDAVKHKSFSLDSLPEEWQKIIADKKKKIIFYNTHLCLFMNAGYKESLIKIDQVFRYFKSRDDVILLWRPHPLTISTIKSMNPVALEPYIQIVEKFITEKWGIYDDTPDMDRAIALSDAYYGSESSVVPVFKETGKPVLIQNVRCNNMRKHELFRISPSAFCVVGDDIWMFHSMMNLLVKYNIVSKTTKIIGQLGGEENIHGTLISDMFYTNGHLIMIPCWAKRIHTYDIKNHSFSEINFDKNSSVNGLFIKSFCVGEKIYCLPFKSNSIVEIDMTSLSIVRYIDIRSQINRNYEYINDACLIDDEKIAFVTVDSYINIFNVKTNKVESFFCGMDNAELSRIICCNDMLFFVEMKSNTLCKWNTSNKNISLVTSEDMYFSISCFDSEIMLDFGQEYRLFDVSNNSLKDIVRRSLSEYNNSLSYFYFYALRKKIEGVLFEFDRFAEILYITKNGVRTEHYVQLTFDELKQVAGGKCLIESELYGLDEMINDLDNSDICNSDIHKSSGNKIHSFLRSIL